MSTIIASNVSDGTLSIPTTYVTNGSAKAWVNFDGTGTIAARDSLNLSSLTDSGTGDYIVNFSNAFGAIDYFIGSSVGGRATSLGANILSPYNNTPTTTSVNASTFNTTWSAAQDCNDISILNNGDLA